jgi:hypothetical protein
MCSESGPANVGFSPSFQLPFAGEKSYSIDSVSSLLVYSVGVREAE